MNKNLKKVGFLKEYYHGSSFRTVSREAYPSFA